MNEIEQMKDSEAEQLAIKVGDELNDICQKAMKKANKIANLYGLEVEMQFIIKHMEVKQKPKRSKKTQS